METFQITVLAVAVIILILIFTAIGIALKNSVMDNSYPPIANTCPEYWRVDASGNCLIPQKDAINSGNIYSDANLFLTAVKDTSGKIYTPGYDSTGKFINFSDAGWGAGGQSAICKKKEWANKNSIEWDGVSNYNACT
jgi:hypothetical protein